MKSKKETASHAFFRFYEELNDFLPRSRRKVQFEHHFNGSPSVKDAIESLGIPHVEVDLVLVNGNPVSFFHRIADGDYVSVFPVFESFDISGINKIRKTPLRRIKFIADAHLGKLARNLRLCGFDVVFFSEGDDSGIISTSRSDGRIILTRDRDLLKNKKVTHGYYIRSKEPDEQLKEVLRRFHLKDLLKLFTRCMECNSLLKKVEKEDISARIEPRTRQFYSEFLQCSGCGRIYWNGSHYERMKKHIDSIVNERQ